MTSAAMAATDLAKLPASENRIPNATVAFAIQNVECRGDIRRVQRQTEQIRERRMKVDIGFNQPPFDLGARPSHVYPSIEQGDSRPLRARPGRDQIIDEQAGRMRGSVPIGDLMVSLQTDARQNAKQAFPNAPEFRLDRPIFSCLANSEDAVRCPLRHAIAHLEGPRQCQASDRAM
jgi:hypothetical protein